MTYLIFQNNFSFFFWENMNEKMIFNWKISEHGPCYMGPNNFHSLQRKVAKNLKTAALSI